MAPLTDYEKYIRTDELLALTSDERWDAGNLFGFDCTGIASKAPRLLDSPLVARMRAAVGSTVTAAVLLYGYPLDEPSLLHPDPPGPDFRFERA